MFIYPHAYQQPKLGSPLQYARVDWQTDSYLSMSNRSTSLAPIWLLFDNFKYYDFLNPIHFPSQFLLAIDLSPICYKYEYLNMETRCMMIVLFDFGSIMSYQRLKSNLGLKTWTQDNHLDSRHDMRPWTQDMRVTLTRTQDTSVRTQDT